MPDFRQGPGFWGLTISEEVECAFESIVYLNSFEEPLYDNDNHNTEITVSVFKTQRQKEKL